MNHISSNASLISYLTPSDNKFYLKLSTIGTEAGVERNSFPFQIIRASDPFALILETSIVSHEDFSIQSAFLFIQKDEPGLPADTLWPVNNHDIDQAWQNSFSLLRNQEANDSFIVLKDQADDHENPVRWRSLFYCTKKQVFFHPPCPRCGSSLDLCMNDDLLNQAGLHPYSTSSKRYLYCPQCLTAGNDPEFYVHSKDSPDLPNVKEKVDVIRGIGQSEANRATDTNLPCADCSAYQECYKTEDQALTRIVSLSFYPFYMLLHKAPNLHLLDFLPLISGASFEDQKKELSAKGGQGRWLYLKGFERAGSRRSLFFFEQNERFFLEVLYLKLSLLAELTRIVFGSLGKLKYPDLGLSIERFWVSVADQNPMLPFFWNFRLRPLGVGFDPVKGSYLPKVPANYGLHVLGFIWFYVLLFNRKNSVTEINEKVAEAFEERSSGANATPDSLVTKEVGGVFQAGNIFWDPEDRMIPPGWEGLWSRALGLGFRLLAGGRADPSKWSEDDFEKELESLREDIRKGLFMPATVEDGRPVETDQAIHEILSEIFEKWQRLPEKASPPAERASTEIPHEDAGILDDIVQETVVLTPEEFKKDTFDLKGPEAGIEADIRPPAASQRSPGISETETSAKDELPETVIVSPGALKEEGPPTPPADENEVPETMIISADKVSKAQTGRKDIQPEDQAGAGGREKETSTEKMRSGRGPEPGEAEEAPDAVPETVIITPGKKGKN